MSNKLTDRGVAATKATGKEWLSDGLGLRLRVLSQSKTWYYVYRITRDSNEIKIQIGSFPSLSLADARKKADEFRVMRELGQDPRDTLKAREREQSLELTIDELFKEYDVKAMSGFDPHNRKCVCSCWKCHVSSSIGGLKIREATKAPVLNAYHASVNDGKLVTPRKALSLLKRVMAWGVTVGLVNEDHPLLNLQLPSKPKAARNNQDSENFDASEYLAKYGDVAIGQESEDSKAGRALQRDELTVLLKDLLPRSSQSITGKLLIKLMLATGIRSVELTRLRWKWLDLSKSVLLIPSSGMKQDKAHHVHLSAYALRQIEELKRLEQNQFLFPAPKALNSSIRRDNVTADIACRQFYRLDGENEQAYQDRRNQRLKKRRAVNELDLYNLSGGKWSLYDLRRTVATQLNLLGYSQELVGRILAHEPMQTVTGRYTRNGQWNERCEALDELGALLQSCEQGGK